MTTESPFDLNELIAISRVHKKTGKREFVRENWGSAGLSFQHKRNLGPIMYGGDYVNVSAHNVLTQYYGYVITRKDRRTYFYEFSLVHTKDMEQSCSTLADL